MRMKNRRPVRTRYLEKLEEKINFAAMVSGIDVGGAHWTPDFFPEGEEAWLQLRGDEFDDTSIGYDGLDKIRIRFSEPVVAGETTGAISLVSHDNLIAGDIGEEIQIASDGLSAIWNLPSIAAEEVFALRTRPDGFVDADESTNVESVLFEFDVLPGDTDGDRAVQFSDFLNLSARFGMQGAGLAEDFVPNGQVEFADFLRLSANFGKELGNGTITERSLISGESATGRLEQHDVHLFVLDAAVGDKLFVTLSEQVASGRFNPGVFLYAPDGTLLTSIEATSNGVSFSDVEAPETGRYTLLVRDSSADSPGDYTLSAVVIDQQIDAGNVTLTSGETQAGSLQLGEIDTLTFEAQVGDVLFLAFSESVASGLFNPGIFLYGPSGELLDTIDAASNGYAISNLGLPQSGMYTIVAQDSRGDSFGDYALSAVIVDASADVGDSTLNSGQPLTGTLKLGEIDTFTFDAEADETLFLTFSESVGTGLFNPGIFLYGPNGELLDSTESTTTGYALSDFALTQTGTHTIVLRDASADSFGDYVISTTVVDESMDVGNTVLNSGEPTQGMLDLGEIDTLTFDAEVGETLFLTFSESVATGLFNPGVFLYSPSGQLLDSITATTFGHAISGLALPERGVYTVVIRDASGDSSGDYTISAVVVDDELDANNTVMASGQTVAGSLPLGAIDTLTIEAVAGESLFLTFSESVASGLFNPGVYIFTPSGELLSEIPATTTGHEVSDLALPESGSYTIVLRDATGDSFGDYVVTAVVVDESMDAGNVVLTAGETVGGMLDLGDIDTFTFDALQNDVRSITLTDTVASGLFNPGVFLYSPDGQLVSQGISSQGVSLPDLTLPLSGTYTIVVRDTNANFAGAYSIQLL